MSINNTQKITRLLAGHRPGMPFLAGWLERHGISRGLQHRYLRSGWLEPLGSGAFQKTGDKVTWLGAVASMQQQAGADFYPGALSALELQGLLHYARFGGSRVFLFLPPRKTLPAWFQRHDWGIPISQHRTNLFASKKGFEEYDSGTFTVRVSSPERAMIECLYLAPDKIDLLEMRDLFPGLASLRPKLIQLLLETCRSIKAKRLTLYLADLSGSPWAKRLNHTRIDLGRGHRRLVEGGDYVSEYELTVPKGLAN